MNTDVTKGTSRQWRDQGFVPDDLPGVGEVFEILRRHSTIALEDNDVRPKKLVFSNYIYTRMKRSFNKKIRIHLIIRGTNRNCLFVTKNSDSVIFPRVFHHPVL